MASCRSEALQETAALLQCSPRGLRRLLLGQNTFTITIACARHRLLMEPAAAAFAAHLCPPRAFPMAELVTVSVIRVVAAGGNLCQWDVESGRRWPALVNAGQRKKSSLERERVLEWVQRSGPDVRAIHHLDGDCREPSWWGLLRVRVETV